MCYILTEGLNSTIDSGTLLQIQECALNVLPDTFLVCKREVRRYFEENCCQTSTTCYFYPIVTELVNSDLSSRPYCTVCRLMIPDSMRLYGNILNYVSDYVGGTIMMFYTHTFQINAFWIWIPRIFTSWLILHVFWVGISECWWNTRLDIYLAFRRECKCPMPWAKPQKC